MSQWHDRAAILRAFYAELGLSESKITETVQRQLDLYSSDTQFEELLAKLESKHGRSPPSTDDESTVLFERVLAVGTTRYTEPPARWLDARSPRGSISRSRSRSSSSSPPRGQQYHNRTPLRGERSGSSPRHRGSLSRGVVAIAVTGESGAFEPSHVTHAPQEPMSAGLEALAARVKSIEDGRAREAVSAQQRMHESRDWRGSISVRMDAFNAQLGDAVRALELHTRNFDEFREAIIARVDKFEAQLTNALHMMDGPGSALAQDLNATIASHAAEHQTCVQRVMERVDKLAELLRSREQYQELPEDDSDGPRSRPHAVHQINIGRDHSLLNEGVPPGSTSQKADAEVSFLGPHHGLLGNCTSARETAVDSTGESAAAHPSLTRVRVRVPTNQEGLRQRLQTDRGVARLRLLRLQTERSLDSADRFLSASSVDSVHGQSLLAGTTSYLQHGGGDKAAQRTPSPRSEYEYHFSALFSAPGAKGEGAASSDMAMAQPVMNKQRVAGHIPDSLGSELHSRSRELGVSPHTQLASLPAQGAPGPLPQSARGGGDVLADHKPFSGKLRAPEPEEGNAVHQKPVVAGHVDDRRDATSKYGPVASPDKPLKLLPMEAGAINRVDDRPGALTEQHKMPVSTSADNDHPTSLDEPSVSNPKANASVDASAAELVAMVRARRANASRKSDDASAAVPSTPGTPAPELDAASPWVQHQDASTGNLYYHNKVTQETSWQEPAEGYEAMPEQPQSHAADRTRLQPAAGVVAGDADFADDDDDDERQDFNPGSPWHEYLPTLEELDHFGQKYVHTGTQEVQLNDEPEEGVAKSWKPIFDHVSDKYYYRCKRTGETSWGPEHTPAAVTGI
jgi:hypothetical protein